MGLLDNTFTNIANSIRTLTGTNDLYAPVNMPAAINNFIRDIRYENVYRDDRANQNYISELIVDPMGETTTVDTMLYANITAFNNVTAIKSSVPISSFTDTKYVVNQTYEITDASGKYSGISALPDPIVVIGSEVTNIANIFSDAQALNCDLGTNIIINGANIQDMSNSFYNCSNLTGTPFCGNNVTNMCCSYFNCNNLTGNVIISSSVENIDNTFDNCRNLNSVILPNKFNNGITTNFWTNCPVSVSNGNLIFY